MDYALLTTTFATQADANVMIEGVLKNRLAACAQSYTVQSQYWWVGAIAKADEVAVHFKLPVAKVSELKSFIEAKHSYKVPQILVYEVKDGHAPYLNWLDEETK